MISYLGLWLAAFAAATLLPAQSEAVLTALLISGKHSAAVLIAVATFGNVLGSLVNWWLGRSVLRWQSARWFPVSGHQLDRAQGWYRRYGRWTLLGSWLPVVGDPLTLVAGVMKEPLLPFLLLVTCAKGLRYVVLAGLVLAWL
ncbi:YqaA family protein [Loktanella salsilacus]|uniref:YqaA family protein n=1 Tax=Loktanella salsilacus TaxID=195913 RepID=UPI0037369CC8